MLWVVLIMGLTALGVLMWQESNRDGTSRFFPMFMLLLLIGATTILGAGTTVQFARETVLIRTESTKIASLRGESGVSGSFILGSGSINEEPQYIYLEKVGDNQYIQRTIPATDLVLEENDTIEPSIRWDIQRHSNLWIFPWWVTAPGDKKIVVPSNTLVKEFIIR